MSETMIPIPFPEMLNKLLTEYKEYKTFYGVPVVSSDKLVPIGPAAGPHTQLAGNIVAAYGAGATYFELKTVQILEGEALQIKKPCIYVGHEVFNTEWSTELTVEQARDEYIKAFLLIQVLSLEFSLTKVSDIHFIMSVGYDLAGIRSQKVDRFLEDMKNAKETEEWRQDCEYIRNHLELFSNVDRKAIDAMKENAVISDTVTLSTMHGCKGEEIESIATYLIKEKQLNTFIKMNPTLIGKERVEELLKEKGYETLLLEEDTFANDITLDMAKKIILSCQKTANQCGRIFGIKLTNTLPVKTKENELEAGTMYMSGPALYPIAIAVANELNKQIDAPLAISYSGGADQLNIKELLETGIKPVTVSSLLLKAGGYKNITKLIKQSEGYKEKEEIDNEALECLAKEAANNLRYDKKPVKALQRQEEYSAVCAVCNNCVDVCPNRANVLVEVEGNKYVIHRDRLCNECGCCACKCIKGHSPYKEKFTIFEDQESFDISNNDGVLYLKEKKRYRQNGFVGEIPENVSAILEQAIKKGRI